MIRLIGCTILGDYDANACIFNVEDESSSFEFYHTEAFESGVVCSAAPVLIYNSEVSVPVSDDAAKVTCQTEGIVDYCAFDCSRATRRTMAASPAGEHTPHVTRMLKARAVLEWLNPTPPSCSPDGDRFDPYLLDDPLTQCRDSPQLYIPQREFTVSVAKEDGPSSLTMLLVNTGEERMYWNVTTTNDTNVDAWAVSPSSGYIDPCEEPAKVTATLNPFNLSAQVDPYQLELAVESNSYQGGTRNLAVSAFVSAEPVPSRSFVTITSNASQLAAGSMVYFVVTPIDAADVVILDTSNQVYFATLTHPISNTSVSCRVVFDTSSEEQQGACEIPPNVCDFATDECSPPLGGFVLQVEHSSGIS